MNTTPSYLQNPAAGLYFDVVAQPKISIQFRKLGTPSRAVEQVVGEFVSAFEADATWYDHALIQAGGEMQIWVTRKVNGVTRAVRSNFRAISKPNAAQAVARLRAELDKIVAQAAGAGGQA